MNIGDNIKRIRKEKKITQKQLAESINKNIRTIQMYESGEIENIPYLVVEDIAKALEVPLSELYPPTGKTINELINMLPDTNDDLSIEEAVKKYIDVIDLGGKICNSDYDNNVEIGIKVKEAHLKALKKTELLNKILEFHNLSFKMNCNSDGSRSYFISDNQDSINKEISEDDFIDFENRILWSIEKEIEYFKKFYMKDNT